MKTSLLMLFGALSSYVVAAEQKGVSQPYLFIDFLLMWNILA